MPIVLRSLSRLIYELASGRCFAQLTVLQASFDDAADDDFAEVEDFDEAVAWANFCGGL